MTAIDAKRIEELEQTFNGGIADVRQLTADLRSYNRGETPLASLKATLVGALKRADDLLMSNDALAAVIDMDEPSQPTHA